MSVSLVGMDAPPFTMNAVMADKSVGQVSLLDNMKNHKWTVLFFYPVNFAFVAPTEITAMSDRYNEFIELNAEVIGVSTDTLHSHLAWINTDRENNGLEQLNFPLATDRNHIVSRKYGVLLEDEGLTMHGLFIINPKGILQYQAVYGHTIGRDVDETLRVLQSLQTSERRQKN